MPHFPANRVWRRQRSTESTRKECGHRLREGVVLAPDPQAQGEGPTGPSLLAAGTRAVHFRSCKLEERGPHVGRGSQTSPWRYSFLALANSRSHTSEKDMTI